MGHHPEVRQSETVQSEEPPNEPLTGHAEFGVKAASLLSGLSYGT